MGLKGWLLQFFYDLKDRNKMDILVQNIVNGGCTIKSPINDLPTQLMLAEIKSRVKDGDTDLDKIKMMKDYYSDKDFEKFLKNIDRALKKRDQLAKKFKKESLLFYRASEFEMAVRCCNLALLFSRPNSALIPELYADRAMCLYELRDFESVIKDVETFIISARNIPTMLRMQMMDMRAECVNLWRDQRSDPESKIRQTYCNDVLFKIHGEPHPQIPSAGSYVSIAEHPFKGRILVATQDLRAGTTVLVENPYVSILTSCIQWELRHCSYCYKKTFAMIPCPSCVFATYCSELCRLTDFHSVHKFECQCLSYLHAIGLPSSTQAGFRVVCKAGPDNLYELFQETTTADRMAVGGQRGIKGFNPETGKYESDSYFQISNLIHHGTGDFPDLLIYYAYNLTKLLEKKTTFFDRIEPKDKTDFFEFIATRLLYHSMSIPYNAMRIWEDEKTELKKRVEESNEHDIDNRVNYEGCCFAGIFSLGSLLSHSCDPSTIRINLNDGKLAVVTQRRVLKGEELTMSYNYKYWTDSAEDRSSLLESEFKFKCTCIACISQWPTLNNIGSNIEFLCPKCSDSRKYSYEEMAQRKCVLVLDEVNSDIGICLDCETVYYISLLMLVFKKHDNMLELAKGFLKAHTPINAIPLLLACIEYFQSRIQQPSLPMIYAQAQLVSAYHAIVKYTRESEE